MLVRLGASVVVLVSLAVVMVSLWLVWLLWRLTLVAVRLMVVMMMRVWLLLVVAVVGVGRARVVQGFTYTKTNGEFAEVGEIPRQAERFSSTLLVVARDTHTVHVMPGEVTEITPRMVNGVIEILSLLSIGPVDLSGDK